MAEDGEEDGSNEQNGLAEEDNTEENVLQSLTNGVTTSEEYDKTELFCKANNAPNTYSIEMVSLSKTIIIKVNETIGAIFAY